MQRLNTAYGYGGFYTAGLTFEYNFGVKPDYFVMVNFNGFRSIINSLGGVTVNAASTFSAAREGYYPNLYTVHAGPVLMDAEQPYGMCGQGMPPVISTACGEPRRFCKPSG